MRVSFQARYSKSVDAGNVVSSKQSAFQLPKKRSTQENEVGNTQIDHYPKISAVVDQDLAFNLEQIVESHPGLNSLLIEHDEVVIGLRSQIEALCNYIRKSSVLHELYPELVSPQALMAMKETGSYRLSQCTTVQEILNAAFGHAATDAEKKTWLAHEIVNKNGELLDNFSHAPFWNMHKQKFLALLNHPSFQGGMQGIQEAKGYLVRVVDQLTQELKQLRKDLALRFCIPYVSNDSVVGAPLGNQFFTSPS